MVSEVHFFLKFDFFAGIYVRIRVIRVHYVMRACACVYARALRHARVYVRVCAYACVCVRVCVDVCPWNELVCVPV